MRPRGDAIEELGAAIGWSLVLLMLLGPVLLPWYVAWALPVVWLLPARPATTVLAAGAALAMAQWSTEPLRYPDAFGVNLWLGHWVVTPVMFVMVHLVTRRSATADPRAPSPGGIGAHTRRGRPALRRASGPTTR